MSLLPKLTNEMTEHRTIPICSNKREEDNTRVLGRLRKRSNHWFDRIVRTEVQLFQRSFVAFQVCGCTGLLVAVALSMLLVRHNGLKQSVMLIILASGVLTFLGLVLLTKVVTGEEKIIYYHHEIVVVTVAAVVLLLLSEPVLSYLDITVICMGLFLSFGRLGCFLVGCCHGRPSRWGVCYRDEHADAGFIPYYVGVRLFPIQLLESLSVFLIIVAGAVLVLNGSPGMAVAWYATAYGVARFCFEFLRGDPDRPYLWGFSQPQWLSLLLILLTTWAEIVGVLPMQSWSVLAATCLIAAMIIVTVARRLDHVGKFRLLHPRHMEEMAATLKALGEHIATSPEPCPWSAVPQVNSTQVAIACTSLGVRLSAAPIFSPLGVLYHYALSFSHEQSSAKAAWILARQILLLKRADGELVRGNRGVFHLLIYPSASRKEPSQT